MKYFAAMGLLAVSLIGFGTTLARADWALAVGQEGAKRWAYGSSWNHQDKADARRKALANCQTRGQNCKVVLDGVGGCVALAIGISDNAWRATQAKTRLSAAQAALDQCVKASSGDCEIKNSFCEE